MFAKLILDLLRIWDRCKDFRCKSKSELLVISIQWRVENYKSLYPVYRKFNALNGIEGEI